MLPLVMTLAAGPGWWEMFFKMNSNSAFVLAVCVAAPCAAVALFSATRTARQKNVLEHERLLQQQAHQAKQIEAKRSE